MAKDLKGCVKVYKFPKTRKSNKNFTCKKKNTSTNIESIPRITNFGRVHTN